MRSSSRSSSPQTSPDQETARLSVNDQILRTLREMNDLAKKVAANPPLRSEAIWTFMLQTLGVALGILFGTFAVLAWKVARDGNVVSASNNDAFNAANEIASSAYAAAISAKSYALEGNQIALFGECQLILSNTVAASGERDLCSTIQSEYLGSLSVYASMYYSLHPTTTIATSVTAPTITTRTATNTAASMTSRTTTLLHTTSTSSQPSSSPTSSSANNGTLTAPGSDGKPSAGHIIGPVVGGVIGILVIYVVAVALNIKTYRAKSRRSKSFREDDKGDEEKATKA